MKHLGSLTMLSLLASGALAASAGAAPVPLQIPGLTPAQVPAQVDVPLGDGWQHPVLPGPNPPSTAMSYELVQPLSDGASCARGVWAVGVAVRPADRPVLAGGTLRLHAEGSLLPRMKVQRHGVAGSVRWYAGPSRAEGGLQVQQGVAVLPAPRWATRAGRSLIVARVSVGLNVRHTAADGSTLPVTAAERSECYAPLTSQLGPQLRALLRKVSVSRRP